MPQTFQTQPQNSRPTNTATAFIRAARLVSHGVSRKPSRLVIDERDAADVEQRISMVPNCRNATTAVPPATMTGPKYGIELNTPASRPQTAACSSPSAAERQPRRHADDRAREHLHEQERLDLPIDLLEDLHGDLLLRQRRPDDLHQLAPVEIARRQQEVDEEEDQHAAGRRPPAMPSEPHMT